MKETEKSILDKIELHDLKKYIKERECKTADKYWEKIQKIIKTTPKLEIIRIHNYCQVINKENDYLIMEEGMEEVLNFLEEYSSRTENDNVIEIDAVTGEIVEQNY